MGKARRLFGFLLIFAAVIGFIFSIIGLFEIWRYRPVITQKVVDTLVLMDLALNTTQDSLATVGQVVQSTTVDVASLQITTRALAKAIHDTNPMLDTLTRLTGKDFPATLDATQASLKSAQSSALLIDNVLTSLTSIPFLPVAPYKPDVPLHTALSQLSTSLNSLTPALVTINSSLVTGKTNLGDVEIELNKITETTQEMHTALTNTQTVIEQYQTVAAQLKMQVESTQRSTPGWFTTIAWILSLMLVWLMFVQLGMLVQGLDFAQLQNFT